MEHVAALFACGQPGPDGQTRRQKRQMRNHKLKDTPVRLRFLKMIQRN